jgi:hypothetical protein
MAGSLHWNFAPSRDFHGEWRGYFGEYTAALREIKTEREENPVRNEVVVPRHSIETSELPRTPRDIVALIPGNWKAQHSQTWHEGAVFKSGPKEGEKRPDKTVDHYAIGLVSGNPLTAVWSDGKMQYAKGVLDGELFWTESVMELKRKIREDWHE